MNALLSTEVLASILIMVAMGLTVRSVIFFVREKAAVAPKLKAVEKDLATWQEGMKEAKNEVDELKEKVAPLQQEEAKLRGYYEALVKLQTDKEMAEEAAKNNQEAESKKRIQRKKMGFESF